MDTPLPECRLILWEKRKRMLGACTICTVTSENGAKTGMPHIPIGLSGTRKGQVWDGSELLEAAVGKTARQKRAQDIATISIPMSDLTTVVFGSLLKKIFASKSIHAENNELEGESKWVGSGHFHLRSL